MLSFNDTLTNNIVSFEQLGPGDFAIFYLISSRKKDLTFHANCLLVKLGDNLHEMSNSIFWGKKRKKVSLICEFAPSVLNINKVII